MLKKVPSMRKKHAEPLPGSPPPAAEVVEQEHTPTPAPRKKTGAKRPSVFGSLFASSSKQAPRPQDEAPLPAAASPAREVDSNGGGQAAPPPSPPGKARETSRDSPPQLPPRKGSKDAPSSPLALAESSSSIFDVSDRPSKVGKEVTVFEVSERKEPSRSGNKALLRAHGSRKELLSALKERGSKLGIGSQTDTAVMGSPNLRPNGGSRVGDMMMMTRGSRIETETSTRSTTTEASPAGQPRYVMSARLPALTIDGWNNDTISVNSFMSAQQMLDSKPRAESDPCPMYGSTLEDDFGFVDEDEETGNNKEPGQVSRKTSFQKPRAPSFNTETRTWEGRRSLQLSVNTKAGDVGAGTVHVSAATLDRLVEYVVSSNEFMEASQVSGFLLTYHSYVNSQGLLSALVSRYDVSTLANDQVARIRTLYVLQRWIEEHWYDFESDDILLMGVVQFALTRLKDFPEDRQQNDPCYGLLRKLASVQQLAQSKIEQKKRMESVSGALATPILADEDEDNNRVPSGGDEVPVRKHSSIAPRLLKHQSRLLIKLEKAPPVDLPKDFSAIWQNKLEGKPMHLILANALVSKLETARQITVLEHNLYKKIPPTELIAQATKQLAKPPEHVRAMIAHFNDVSKFVALSICSFTEVTPRAYMLRKWIKIGRECLRLNNYNAVFEIMAGIHSVAVHRLNKTKAALNVKTKHILGKLEEVTSRKNNYGTYRTMLAQNTVPIQPAVPFIGATLTDLSFLDFGHRNMVENGEGDTLINFTKHRRVAQVMGTIKKFQDHPYLLDTSPELYKFLLHEMNRCAQVSDKEVYALSLVCEPAAQTAGGQAQMAFFDFATEAHPSLAAVNSSGNGVGAAGANGASGHKREESKGTFLFGFKKN